MGGSDSGTFLDTVATVDVVDVLSARNNTELAETRTVLFEDSRENKQTRQRFLVLANLSLVFPRNT